VVRVHERSAAGRARSCGEWCRLSTVGLGSMPSGDRAYLAAVTDNTHSTRRIETTEAEFRHGTQAMATQMASGYEPPSMSLSPAAPAEPPASGGGAGTSPAAAPAPTTGGSAGAASSD
jgi:hypothetical protein